MTSTWLWADRVYGCMLMSLAHRGLGDVGVVGAAVNPEVAEESVAVLC